MSNKNLLIIPDDAYIKSINNTFIEYDLEGKNLVGFEPQTECLVDECVDDSRPKFRPFGVCEHKGDLLIASHTKVAAFSSANKNPKPVLDYPLFLNTHQMCSDGETLFISNTSVDTIGIHNDTGTTYYNVRTGEFSEECKAAFNCDIRDSKHVNALTVADGFLYYCMHNLNVDQSSFGRINLTNMTNEHLFDCGVCCHDVLIYKNTLYSNSSGNGFLIVHDLETNKTNTYEITNPETNFLRGLVEYDGQILVGVSNNQTRCAEANNSHIFAFKPDTLEYTHFMAVPDVLSIVDMIVINKGGE